MCFFSENSKKVETFVKFQCCLKAHSYHNSDLSFHNILLEKHFWTLVNGSLVSDITLIEYNSNPDSDLNAPLKVVLN